MVKKISFPSMGHGRIAFSALLDPIPGVEVFFPPDVNRDIVKIGAQYSPEFVCLPFKITLGEFINMHKKYGIDTFVQATDCGPCRFGFYAPVQERIMKDLGYDVEIIPIAQEDILNFRWLKTFYRLTNVEDKFMRMVDIVRCIRLFFLKSKYLEDIRKIEGFVRCREVNKGETTEIVENLLEKLHKENNIYALHSFSNIIKNEFEKMEINREIEPLRVKFAGENHVCLESFANMDLVKKLGEEGVEVHLGNTLYDWIMHKCRINFHRKELAHIGKEYIPLDIGGEAQWVIGDYIKSQEEGLDGFIHVYPFTCMPENSARGILEGQSPNPFYLPIQFYSLDEHTGYEGLRTRIEAFIELMKSNRRNNPRFQDTYVEPKLISEIWDKKEENILEDFMEGMVKPFMKTTEILGKSLFSALSESENNQ